MTFSSELNTKTDATGRIIRTWDPEYIKENHKEIYGYDAVPETAIKMENDIKFHNDLKKVIAIEGGYVNDPKDPGGETNMGISKNRYPNEDIKAVTPDRRNYLYYRDFYTNKGLNTLPDGIREDVLNIGINEGPEDTTKRVQRIVGTKADGRVGPKTLKAIEDYNDMSKLQNEFKKEVNKYYKSRPDADYFSGRVKRLYKKD